MPKINLSTAFATISAVAASASLAGVIYTKPLADERNAEHKKRMESVTASLKANDVVLERNGRLLFKICNEVNAMPSTPESAKRDCKTMLYQPVMR